MQYVSATQFIERIGCKYESSGPNDIDFIGQKSIKKDATT